MLGSPAPHPPNPTMSTPSGLPVAPLHPVPMTPAPEPISLQDYTARIEQGWVPVMGLPGTPITAGFIRDLGEYNPKLEGINGIWTYQEMRRGDGQVAGHAARVQDAHPLGTVGNCARGRSGNRE